MGLSEVERCCRRFVTKIETDLRSLGVRPDEVIRR